MNREKLKLFKFCRTHIYGDMLVFDEIFNIYDRVINFLIENNLELKYEKQILLIKITNFVYENSNLLNT
jgi:hypothetical protein